MGVQTVTDEEQNEIEFQLFKQHLKPSVDVTSMIWNIAWNAKDVGHHHAAKFCPQLERAGQIRTVG